MLAVAACIVVGLPLIGKVLGYRTMVVASGSMAPYAQAGDALVLRSTEAGELRAGQVITFRSLGSGGLITHRILRRVDIDGTPHFQTRGDANSAPDSDLVPTPNVLGRVAFRVPDLGAFYWFATSVTSRILLVVVPAILLVWGEMRDLQTRRVVRRRSLGASLSAATTSLVVVVGIVLGIGAPAAGLFQETNSVPSNGFATSRVNAPTLNSATYSGALLNCRITLAWSVPGSGLSPDGYDVYRSTTSGGPYTLVQHVGAATTFQDSGLAVSTTYHYVLQSTHLLWRSSNSNQRSASTPLLCL